jgi:hypothetical protein
MSTHREIRETRMVPIRNGKTVWEEGIVISYEEIEVEDNPDDLELIGDEVVPPEGAKCLLCGDIGSYMSSGVPSFVSTCDCPAGRKRERWQFFIALFVYSTIFYLWILTW